MLEKVLILGGTGAMGSYLTRILSSRYSVVVTTRREYVNCDHIQYVVGNAHSLTFLMSLLKDNHFKAIIDFMNYSTEEFIKRYELLLSATEQLFYISSSRVYAGCEQRLTEESPRLLDILKDDYYLKTDDYAIAKARQEDILKNSRYKNWTIIRPYMTYSPNRLDLGYFPKELWLYRALTGKTILFPKSVAKSVTTLTYGLDVATGIAALIGRKEALNEIYHITTNECLKWEDIISIYRKVLLDNDIEMQVIYTEYNYHKNEYIHKYDRVYNRKFDNHKIANYINVNNFMSIEDGIRGCLEEFIRSPQFNSIDWKKMALYDRLLHEKTPISAIFGLKQKLIYLILRYIIPYEIAQSVYSKIKRNIAVLRNFTIK